MELSAQMEDYLEAIFVLCRDKGVARVKDIASRLKVTNPSVVGAVRTLKRKKLVRQEHYGFIRLTDQGSELARSVLHRHSVLTHFLESILGLDADTAASDACRIEHAVSPETVRRLRAVAAFLQSEAHEDLDWTREFKRFYRSYRENGKP